ASGTAAPPAAGQPSAASALRGDSRASTAPGAGAPAASQSRGASRDGGTPVEARGGRGGFGGSGFGGSRGATGGDGGDRQARMLERLKTMTPDEQQQFIARMKERGVDTSELEKQLAPAAKAKPSTA